MSEPRFMGPTNRNIEEILQYSDWASERLMPESDARKLVKYKLKALRYVNPVVYRQLIAPFSTDEMLLAMWRQTGDPRYLAEIKSQAKWEAKQAKRWAKKAEIAEIGLKNEKIKDFAAYAGFMFKLAQEHKMESRKVAALMALNMAAQFTAAAIDNDLRKVAAVYELDPTYEYFAKLIEEGKLPSHLLLEEAIKYRRKLRKPNFPIRLRSPIELVPPVEEIEKME